MEWTREKPSKPGYYWLFDGEISTSGAFSFSYGIVEIYEDFDDSLIVLSTGDERESKLSEVDGWWYGPLQLPVLSKGLVKKNNLS